MKGKKAADSWEEIKGVESTGDIIIPSDPLDRVLGQEEAIHLAKIAAIQRRHLLLVGPPGTGKSMIARALSMNLPKPKEEIRIVKNPENPERPFLEVLDESQVNDEDSIRAESVGKLLRPEDVQRNIAERLGYLCKNCGKYSLPADTTCPFCSKSKMDTGPNSNPFGDLLSGMLEAAMPQGVTTGRERVHTTRTLPDGTEEMIIFERAGDRIRQLDSKALEKRNQLNKKSNQKVLVKLNRNPFVLATGASETELLGDVRHDPYGGHEKLGSPAYERVTAGSIHEAHEGILFIDEISHLGNLQRYILTAMQEKKFPIVGHNPQSAGASVKVEDVPCDFILVAACNIQDLENILSPLRSRIIGGGYEILVDTAMPDNPRNRAKYAQFVAQEVLMDGHIPHATIEAVEAIIAEGRHRAKSDNQPNALTLRLRELGGLIRAAGDIAVMENAPLITANMIREARKRSRPVEDQIKERYGSYMKGVSKDVSGAQKEKSQYYFENEHLDDQMFN
ncbi:archaeal Lon protease [Candidatus Methanoplasma termitum]|uniref:Lon protein n=1 Tax=Candidatus Methanoplasma termitum TaxID=1577791 RepID=A0A0A7LBV1_9ARCH|nr:ATP-binding protein [Candidatus Methanoplasma termitum]AIZ56610.1 archaeal Lon protease [Candidatus Methanoplasma termitum]MCL2334089.1 ATP-binding protein [Candidatus Methanoplasma sp.]